MRPSDTRIDYETARFERLALYARVGRWAVAGALVTAAVAVGSLVLTLGYTIWPEVAAVLVGGGLLVVAAVGIGNRQRWGYWTGCVGVAVMWAWYGYLCAVYARHIWPISFFVLDRFEMVILSPVPFLAGTSALLIWATVRGGRLERRQRQSGWHS